MTRQVFRFYNLWFHDNCALVCSVTWCIVRCYLFTAIVSWLFFSSKILANTYKNCSIMQLLYQKSLKICHFMFSPLLILRFLSQVPALSFVFSSAIFHEELFWLIAFHFCCYWRDKLVQSSCEDFFFFNAKSPY